MSRDHLLKHRIQQHYDEFPRSERRLADLVLKQSGNLAIYSASELAQEAGVSKATTARFFKRLGYSNFRQAREHSRQSQQAEDNDNIKPAVSKADVSHISADISLHVSSDSQNLRHTFEAIRSDDLRAAIQTLATAEKIWVVGFDDDYALAHFARAMLIRIKPDIRMIPLGGFSVPEEFASITSSDAILGFAVKRRSLSLLRIVRSGYDAGARVILITDENMLKPELDILNLRCRTRGAFLFDSMSAPFSLMTYVCSAVASILGEPAVERLHHIESLYDHWGNDENL